MAQADALKREALATADALIREHMPNLNGVEQAIWRAMLAMAYVEGWGSAGEQAQALVREALEGLR